MKNTNSLGSLISGKTAIWTALGIGAFALARTIYKGMTKYDLRSKVVLITGGSRGLGLAMARQFADKGAKLVICARNSRQLENARLELEASGADVLALKVDVTSQIEVEQMIQQAIDRFGRLDVLVNNAGIMALGPESVMEIEDYKNAMNVNLWSSLYAIKATIPHFNNQGEGRIVNICSIGGKIAVPHMLPYSVSKFAMVGLSEGIGAELKNDNIHVTTVIPNLMRTGSPRNVTIKGDHEAEYAWFKVSDSSPLLSQNADDAAKDIIEALEQGENEVILTQMGKVAIALQGLMPGAVNSVMQLANRFLPKSENTETKIGFESESESSNGMVSSLTDEASIKYNEL